MPGLTQSDRERTRYHLGYLNTSFAPSIQLGQPRPVQTLFLVEDAMSLIINPQAVSRVICMLDALDRLEAQLLGAVGTLSAERLGNLTLHPLRSKGLLFTDSIEKEYGRWARRLADHLGVPLYPHSARFKKTGPGSSVSVSG